MGTNSGRTQWDENSPRSKAFVPQHQPVSPSPAPCPSLETGVTPAHSCLLKAGAKPALEPGSPASDISLSTSFLGSNNLSFVTGLKTDLLRPLKLEPSVGQNVYYGNRPSTDRKLMKPARRGHPPRGLSRGLRVGTSRTNGTNRDSSFNEFKYQKILQKNPDSSSEELEDFQPWGHIPG